MNIRVLWLTWPMPADAPATSPDAVRSLAWSAAIERKSASLPHRRGIRWFRRRDFFHDSRVAVAASLDPTSAFPGSGVFLNPQTGTSMLIRPDRPQVRSEAIADVVVAGGMRTAEQLRFRSFYVSDRPARSLAVHQRRTPTKGTPLARGVHVQMEIHGRIPFVVPRVLETGLARVNVGDNSATRAAVDWVVEEALDGSIVPGEEADETAREMLTLLAQSWQTLGVGHAPIDPAQQAAALAAFADLMENPPPEIWPADVDRQATWRRAEEILKSTQPVTTGFSHGDPGIGNVLRLTDGRLALVDWEHAEDRLVAHDVLKVVMSTPDPPAFAAALETPVELRPALSAANAAPWRRQVAVALLLFLGGWRNRHVRALKRRSGPANTRRMHAILRTLMTLADG